MSNEKQHFVDNLDQLNKTLYEKAAPGDKVSFKFRCADPVGFQFFKGGLQVENLFIKHGINLNDSYPDTGLKGIHLVNLTVRGGARGIFLGGYNVDGLFIDGCDVQNDPGGTHTIYISGGGWDKYPEHHLKNIHISRTRARCTPAGRNNIQFNARAENCSVTECELLFPQLNHCTVIGVQGFEFSNNLCYGGNRGSGIVVYDYAHSWAPYYNFFETDEDVEKFLKTKWPNKNHRVYRNTMIVGPKQFSKGWGHFDDPTKNHPGILINNAIHSGFTFWNPNKGETGEHVKHPGFPFPNENLIFFDNVVTSPSKTLVRTYHEHEAKASQFIGNMFWTEKGDELEVDAHTGKAVLIGNTFEDPGFDKLDYPFVNLDENPKYQWIQYPGAGSFDAFSWKCYRRKKGIKFPVPVYSLGAVRDPLGIDPVYDAEVIDPEYDPILKPF
jgi:hypothetical protein